MRKNIPSLLAWTAGMLIAFYPILFSAFSLSQFDLGDSRMNNYVLEHSWLWLIRVPAHASFWNPPIFYPAENVAAYTDVLLGAAPIYWLTRAVGFLPDTAFQLWTMALATLNFWVFRAWLKRGLGFGEMPAASGSFLFAFASYRMAQLSHIQLHAQFFTILALYAATRLLADLGRDRKWIVLFCASAVAQLYAGFYLGWMLAIGLALVALLRPVPVLKTLKRDPLAWALGAALSAAAVYPLVSHSLQAAHTVGWRTYDGMDLARPWSWFYLGPESWIYGGLYRIEIFRAIPLQLEHYLGLGLITTVAAIVGLRGNRWLRTAAIASLILVLAVTRWTDTFALWRWIYPWLPGAEGLRALPRVALLLLIPLSVGYAQTIDRAGKYAFILLAFAILEQGRSAPSFDKLAARRDVARIVAKIDRATCSSFLYAPQGSREPNYKIQLDAMWAEAATAVPTVNGYSGNFPPGWSAQGWTKNTETQTCRVF